VNDHTIIKGADNEWHLYGTTSFDGQSYQERYFVHAKGKELVAPFSETGKSIDRGTLAWAPCTIERDGIFYMLYGPSPTSLAVSFDMYEWFGHNVTLNNEPLMSAHRDHFVLKLEENKYLMYVAGISNNKGAISCYSSCDLLTWNFECFALTSGHDAPLNTGWGAMESPFVLKKDGLFYLFVTYTDSSSESYNNTLVFCSSDPYAFGMYNGETGGVLPVTKIEAHAPEIIEENGKYFITTCGWLEKPTPHKGCVSIAELDWK
jgi:beta-fructofuranosidase